MTWPTLARLIIVTAIAAVMTALTLKDLLP